MGKLIRHEFIGNPYLFWILFILGITLPFAILYLIRATVTVEEELENPSEFLEAFRTAQLSKKK